VTDALDNGGHCPLLDEVKAVDPSNVLSAGAEYC